MASLKSRQGFGYVLLALAIILVIYLNGSFIKNPRDLSIGVIALAVGYFSGLLALIVGVLFSIYTLVLSLPLISAVYGFIAYTLARIHYMLATFVFKKILKRTNWYRKTRAKIKNSRAYKKLRGVFNKVMNRIGLREPQMLRLFEVSRCTGCAKLIPRDGLYCPYCKKKQG